MRYISMAILAAIFIISMVFYGNMPEHMPTHWNAYGEADDYSSRFWGVWLLPFISMAVFILLVFIPRMNPKSMKHFMKPYEYFVTATMAFLLLLHLGSLLNAVWSYNFNLFLLPLLAAFLYFVGYFLKFCKRNYLVGIRTPWTLASDKVWDKTHHAGSFVFRLIAFAIVLSIIWPQYLLWLIIGSIILNIAFFFVYSYWLWKKDIKKRHMH